MASESEIGFVHGKGVEFTDLSYSQWPHYFLSIPVNESEVDVLTKEIDIIKPKVLEILTSQDDDETLKSKVLLIQLLVSLGLAFHFENEIKDIVKHAFQKIDDIIGNETDLETISTMFRVLRTYGHNVSSDIFKRFTGNNGKFEESLATDVKCILSLYEAAHMGTSNDHILDEALSFTSSHLKSLVAHGTHPPHILRLIRNTLHLPERWNMEAIVAREYILFYEQEESKDKMLLKLAKLSFKLLQSHYIKELQTLFNWLRDLDVTYKFPIQFRESMLQYWFAGLVMYFEPQYSSGRVIIAKLIHLLTIHDDASDRYYSFHELETLMDCVERWNLDDVNELEGIKRMIFQLGFDVFDDIERTLESQDRSHDLKEILEECKICVKSNFKLLKWAQGTEIPSFEEYIEVGGAAAGVYTTTMSSLIGMSEIIGKEAYAWVMSRPKLLTFVATKCRLMDDMTDFETDMTNGYLANAVNYYMKQYEVNKEEAMEKFHKMIVDINKSINDELLKTPSVPSRVQKQALNFGRLVDILYVDDDIFNCSDGKLKEYMVTLFVDPICL